MQTKPVHELRLLDRTNENSFGQLATITALTYCGDGKIVITTTGWRTPGDPFIDSVTRKADDVVDVALPSFIGNLIDIHGHLFPSCEAVA